MDSCPRDHQELDMTEQLSLHLLRVWHLVRCLNVRYECSEQHRDLEIAWKGEETGIRPGRDCAVLSPESPKFVMEQVTQFWNDLFHKA